MSKKKKNKDPQAKKPWFFVIGSLIAAVISLILAFLAGRDYFYESFPEDQEEEDQEEEDQGEEEDQKAED